MRRNILTYKAPEGNEGYDLICIHPEPRYKPNQHELAQVRVQVKSCYATDCDRGFPIKEKSLDAFDFLVITFLNIGKFYGKHDGSVGAKEPEFYTLTPEFIRKHHDASSSWQKVKLKKLQQEIEPFKYTPTENNMPIPDFQTLMLPILQFLGDEQIHSLREMIDHLSEVFELSEEELKMLLPSGQQPVFSNRVGWSKTHLKKVGETNEGD